VFGDSLHEFFPKDMDEKYVGQCKIYW
jgi:hypothetical protein